jgi:sulfite exporter TauE/SafE/copper chaperone CopZ
MHCKACEILLETELAKDPDVTEVKADLAHKQVLVTTKSNIDEQTLAKNLNLLVQKNGYILTNDKSLETKNYSEITQALVIALVIGSIFFSLQKLGLANWFSGFQSGFALAFVVGLVASISSCMAVVGGLVLSISASLAKQNQTNFNPQKTKSTHLLFHLGRLAGFFILGGILGLSGTLFTLNSTASTILSVVVALVMLGLGLNLINLFNWTGKMQISLPTSWSKKLFAKPKNTQIGAVLLGTATFFLPCGFTQSMQIYALSTGSFLTGALTMFVFALGTLPVLALISFSSFNFSQSKFAGLFLKTAGFLVIGFALFNFYAILVTLGLVPPILNT